jgi:hypothetical protein
VIAVDTNVLVYAHRSDAEWHDRAAARMRSLAEGRGTWAIPWPCIHEFFAIATHPRVYDPPSPILAAIEQVEAWMESPSLLLIGENPAHWATLRLLVTSGRIAGPKIHDARIAAICLAHGVETLWTADRDFSRFPALQAVNPLAGDLS